MAFYFRSLDIDWQMPPEKGHSHDMTAILWKGSREYDKLQDEMARRDCFKELCKNSDKKEMNIMETDPHGKCGTETFSGLKTLDVSELKKVPTNIGDMEKGKNMEKREIRRKFDRAMDVDDRTGSEIQRGWCGEHRNWCPIFSQCLPEDPLVKDHAWLVSMRRGQADTPCWKQKCEKLMRLRYEEQEVDFGSWIHKAIDVVNEDMNSIDGSGSTNWRIWPFTCYSIFPNHKNLPCEMFDISQEELRFQMYEQKKEKGEKKYIKLEEKLIQTYERMRGELKLSYYGQPLTTQHWEQFLFRYFNSLVEGQDMEGQIKCHLSGEMNHFLLSSSHCTEICTFRCVLQNSDDEQVNVKSVEKKEENKSEFQSGEESSEEEGTREKCSGDRDSGEVGSGEVGSGEVGSGEVGSSEEGSNKKSEALSR